MADSANEVTEAPVKTTRQTRNPLESIVGRFKGFFENDEAVN
jgi:hypothetical protein